jgi:predicted DNA-binding protein (MmcQ/YjbR family)
MKPSELKAACLALNGAEETFPFNPETSVFKVGGKIFALTALDAPELRVSLKCEPELAVRLREAHPAITGGWHLNKRHWNTVLLDGSVPDDLVREMIEDSYDLIVAKLSRAQRLLLDWSGDRDGDSRPLRPERSGDGPPA